MKARQVTQKRNKPGVGSKSARESWYQQMAHRLEPAVRRHDGRRLVQYEVENLCVLFVWILQMQRRAGFPLLSPTEGRVFRKLDKKYGEYGCHAPDDVYEKSRPIFRKLVVSIMTHICRERRLLFKHEKWLPKQRAVRRKP